MPTLSSAIVKQGVASVSDVERALARQVIQGGDLVTNLLEVASVSEERLVDTLAQLYQLEAAGVGELPRSSDDVLRLVPGDLSERQGIYPLAESAGNLRLAVSEPLPAEVEEDLSFALGVRVKQCAAPLVRIRQAIARDYGMPLGRRMLRLLAKLDGRPDPSPSSMPSPSAATAEPLRLPRPASLPPIGYPSTPHMDPGSATEGPASSRIEPSPVTAIVAPDESAEATPGDPGLMPSQPPSMRLPPRLGPYPGYAAEQDLSRATSRDQVIRAFFDFASQYFEYSALFAVHADIAEGREARGPGANRHQIRSIGVPLDLPSAMHEVRQRGQLQLVRLSRAGLDAGLARDLHRDPNRKALLMPVLVRERCVLILYGDHGARDVEMDPIGDVIAIAPMVSRALERIILERKRMVLNRLAQPGSFRSEGVSQPEQRKEPSHAIPPPPPQEPPPTPAADADRKAAVFTAPTVPVGDMPSGADLDATPLVPEAELEEILEKTRDSSPDAAAFPLTRRSVPPRFEPDEEPPEDDWDSVAPPPPAAPIVDEQTSAPALSSSYEVPASPPAPPLPHAPDPVLSAPRPERSSAPQPEADPDVSVAVEAEADNDSPDISVAPAEADDSWEIEDIDALTEAESEPQPASRVLSFSARTPRAAHEADKEMALPTFIVDVKSDCVALLEKALEGDLQAESGLLEMGESAVAVLMERFPGPIATESQSEGKVAASQRGPLLALLTRFGMTAVGPLTERAADSGAVGREWAIRLLGEIPTAESVRALIPLLLDEATAVRRAALDAARLLIEDADARRLLHQRLTETAAYEAATSEVRQHAIRALADLHEPLAVPQLVRLLEQVDQELSKEARRALVIIARQDFGGDARRWREWWKRNQTRHRIEWLIDALTHDQSGIRLAAGEELKALSKEYFGYYDDLPRKERARAQKRYRHWWETKGKALFRSG